MAKLINCWVVGVSNGAVAEFDCNFILFPPSGRTPLHCSASWRIQYYFNFQTLSKDFHWKFSYWKL